MKTGFVKTNRSILQYEKWRNLSFAEQGFLENLALMSGWKEEEKGLVKLSIRTFEKESGKSHTSIQSLLSKLKEKGIVSVKASKEGTCIRIEDEVYQYLVQGVPESSTRNNNEVYQNQVHCVPESSTAMYQNQVQGVPESSTQKSLYHINIEEKKNIEDIEDILPMTSQDIPPYGDEDEEFFASLTPLDSMDYIIGFEGQKQVQNSQTQTDEARATQGTLPGIPPTTEKASEKQRKPKGKYLPQWEQDFEDWWKVYLSLSKGIEGKGGKAVGKTEARKAWEGLRNKGELLSLSDMIEGLKKYATLNGWERNSQKYIPHASTFLNQKRWEDELSRNFTSFSTIATDPLQPQAQPQPQPEQAYTPWHEIRQQMSRYGEARFKDTNLNDATRQAIIAIGGWVSLCRSSERELTFKAIEYNKIARGA